MTHAGSNFFGRSRTSRVCCKSTRTFACKTTPTARNVLSPSRCKNGHERGKFEIRISKFETSQRLHLDRIGGGNNGHPYPDGAALSRIQRRSGSGKTNAGEE